MIEELQQYFTNCPVFSGREVNIDYLADHSGSVSIRTVECDPVIKSYRTGGSLRQYCFSLDIRCPYRGTLADGLKNEQLCEELADWVELQSDTGNLPLLKKGTAQRLELTSGGYSGSEKTNYANYQIGLRLIYTKI